MSVTRLDHIYVETRDFPRAQSFWQALGFSVASSWGDAGHQACLLTSEKASVVLAETDPESHPQHATVHFGGEDPELLDETLANHEAVEVVVPLIDTHWGTRWIRVRDPDGNLYAVEFPKG